MLRLSIQQCYSIGSCLYHGHEGVGLRLHGADSGDVLDGGEELLLGEELSLLPGPELLGGKGHHHLVVEAAAANHPLNRLHPVHFLDVVDHRVEALLEGSEGCLVVVGGPLTTPNGRGNQVKSSKRLELYHSLAMVSNSTPSVILIMLRDGSILEE